MVSKMISLTVLLVCVAFLLLPHPIDAERLSVNNTRYTQSLNSLHQTLATGPVLPGAEKLAEAAPLSISTGAWLISIGLIGFIVSRQRFKKKDD